MNLTATEVYNFVLKRKKRFEEQLAKIEASPYDGKLKSKMKEEESKKDSLRLLLHEQEVILKYLQTSKTFLRG